MSSNVHLALRHIVERAEANPEEALVIEHALFALKSALNNTLSIVEIASHATPSSLACVPVKTSMTKFLERAEGNDISSELAREFGLVQPLRLKQLQALVREVGTTHGLFPTQAEMRSKPGLLLWIRANRDGLEPELSNYVRTHFTG